MRPKVVICDESTSALDASTRDSIVDLLSNLMRNRNLALVFISHDDHIIKGLAHQILVMADGLVVEQGLAVDVIKYPTHALTKKIFSNHATSVGRSRL
jgi:ABC-type microcin C transport system duplicated ATPase subunit YejF